MLSIFKSSLGFCDLHVLNSIFQTLSVFLFLLLCLGLLPWCNSSFGYSLFRLFCLVFCFLAYLKKFQHEPSKTENFLLNPDWVILNIIYYPVHISQFSHNVLSVWFVQMNIDQHQSHMTCGCYVLYIALNLKHTFIRGAQIVKRPGKPSHRKFCSLRLPDGFLELSKLLNFLLTISSM